MSEKLNKPREKSPNNKKRSFNNSNLNNSSFKEKTRSDANETFNKFNPIINIYIYDIVVNKKTSTENQFYFNKNAKQGFKELKVNNEIKGIIFPLNYNYKGTIEQFIPPNSSDRRVYTSDILTSVQDGGSKENLKDFDYLYKVHRTKEINFKNNQNRPFYTLDRILDIIKIMKKTIMQIKKFHNPSLNFQCNNCNNCSNNIPNNLINKNNINPRVNLTDRLNNSYIFNIHISKNDKIVIFGDFHGSFHAFYRIFLRLHILNIIDFNNYTINDGYKIIFLGDIADRGQYALEIFYIIFKFICKNNNDPNNPKILLNRGNHEEPSQWTEENKQDYGLTAEIRKKIIDQDDKTTIIDLFKKLLSYCSSGIVLTYHDDVNNHRYWLSHGGIPIQKIPQNKANILSIGNQKCIYVNSKLYSTSMRWGDYNAVSREFKPGGRPQISMNDLNNFLNINNIDFIIRGHQDDNENAYLLSGSRKTNSTSLLSYDYVYPLNDIDIYNANPNNRNILNLNKHIIFPEQHEIVERQNVHTNQINGPVAQIRTKNWYTEKTFHVKMNDIYDNPSRYRTVPGSVGRQGNIIVPVYPVLTISTNSDTERTLNKDSFIILDMNSQTNGRLNYNMEKANIIINLNNV